MYTLYILIPQMNNFLRFPTPLFLALTALMQVRKNNTDTSAYF
ncbi:hypothetical protein APHCR_1477 [Anaplasma phagocytophilum str. CR1007]|nr:hypothetical protein APHCR_1477 [Anaplasma phagocytophilum str. CR1007]